MRFGLLGPLEVVDDDGTPVEVRGRQPRLVLAALLVAASRPVTAEALADAVWGEAPPPSATGSLQTYVSRLRKLFEGHPGAARILFDDAGYRLEVDPAAVDLVRFEQLADEGRGHLDAGRPGPARAALGAALALWRGPALLDLADRHQFVGAATRLEERRLGAIEDRIDADMALGRHGAVVGELAALVAEHPLREGLQAKRALALYRADRQADALRSLSDAGRTLRDELGIEPGRLLRQLEAAILAHDPSLDLPSATAPLDPAGPADGGPSAAPTAPGPTSSDPGGPRPTTADRPPPEVASEAPASPAPAPVAVPLVGRDAELGQLVAILDEARHDARFVVIEGEPGIGKSRLADEVRVVATGRGSLAVWGRSDEGGAAPALWPWLPVLRSLAAAHDDVPAVLSELVAGEAPLLAGQGAAVQFERFEALAELLEDTGSTAPVAVLLDDLQWADATSLELLSFLTSRLRRGALVVATVRPLEVGRNDAVTDALGAIARRPGSRRLQLRGLSVGATTELLRAAGATTVPERVSARIHARAEGNPFYALELARLADEEGGLDGGEVPATVGDVIRRRLARLPAASVELLAVAAVTGRDVDLQLLARGAELDLGACLDLIEPAVVHRLLIDVPDRPGSLRFSHALVREVLLLDGLTSLRRARLHLKVADAIERTGAGLDDVEILAEHLWRAARVGVGRRAAEALEQAAEVAVRRVSYAAAEVLLARAVQLRRATGTSEDDQRAELATAVRLLEVMQATRYFQGADREVLARAKDLAARFDLDDLGRTLFWYEWAALATSARVEEAAPLAQDYLERTSTDPRADVRAGGHEVYGTSCWGTGRIAEAVEHFDLAVDMLAGVAPPADAFEAEQRLVAHTFRLANHSLLGDWSEDEVFAGFDALVAASPTVAVPSICGFAGTTACTVGRWDQLEHFMERARDADPGSQFAFWGGQLRMFQGIVAAHHGQSKAGLAAFAEGRAHYAAIGARSGLPTFQATMALVVARDGRHHQAASELVMAARREVDLHRERWNEPVVLIGEAVVAATGDDPARAAERLATAVTVATAQGAHALARRALTMAADLGVVLPG